MHNVEMDYYLLNEGAFLLKHPGKYLVIKGNKLLGVYNSHFEAYMMTAPFEPIDTYLIRHCRPGVAEKV
jgi:hypothetical protein